MVTPLALRGDVIPSSCLSPKLPLCALVLLLAVVVVVMVVLVEARETRERCWLGRPALMMCMLASLPRCEGEVRALFAATVLVSTATFRVSRAN